MNKVNRQNRQLSKATRDDSLPSSLTESLADLTKLSRKIFSIKFGSLLLVSLCVSWLALFLSDRLWDTPIGVRLFLSCSGWLFAVGFAWMIRRNAFLRSASSKWLARQVRAKFGGPGDRFLGIIELAGKRKVDSAYYSESLYSAALQRVEKEITQLPLADTFDRRACRKAGIAYSPHSPAFTLTPDWPKIHHCDGPLPGRTSSVRPSLGFPKFPPLFTPQKVRQPSFVLPSLMIRKKNPMRLN